MTDYPTELRRIAADIRADLRLLHRDAALLDQAAEWFACMQSGLADIRREVIAITDNALYSPPLGDIVEECENKWRDRK